MKPNLRLSPIVLWLSLESWRARLPGLIIAALLAFAANGLAGGLGDPLARNPLLVAMLLGLVIGNAFGCPERLRPGLQFTTRYVLRLAVVLVGFRITARLLVDLGAGPVLIAAAELCLVLLGVFWIAHKIFKLDREFSLLLAAGSAICGAAAILSVASLCRIRTQQAGMDIKTSLEASLKATSNGAFIAATPLLTTMVMEGEDLTYACRATKLFPADVIEMMHVGETSGTVPETLQHLGPQFEERARRGLALLTTVFAGMVWLFVAILITFFIFRIAMFYIGMLNAAASGNFDAFDR